MSKSNFRLQFPESLGLLGLLGILGLIARATDWYILQNWIAGFAGFSFFSLRLFRKQNIKFPARIGLLGFMGFLGFLGFLPDCESLKLLFGLFGFGLFFVFLGKSQT